MSSFVLLLFGKSGAGKSFAGDILAELLGWHVYHADADITDEMRAALSEHRPFTNEMRDHYFQIMVDKVLDLKRNHQCIVVTQAVYKKQHRDYLLSNIPDLELVCVQSTEGLISERLSKREGGISSASARALSNDFEAPEEGAKVIKNNGSKFDLIRQFINIAQKMPNTFSQQDIAKLRLCLRG
ncbi:shikimate kinase [Alkalimarinus coralli]|uniref:shikimate kinase n=1 Tax=Alkalimarinus coralli TaxID=2935863 RepID=UPI00202B733A|nr:shikimate kinase [Alkalimarinus coralli]